MADGLLSNILNFIDQRKQASMAGLGLLASNPQEYLTGRAEQLRDFTRAQEAALPAERAQLRGLLVSPEQQAAQQYANQQLQDVALGFAGNIKPVKPLGSIVEDATKSGLKLDLYEKNGVINLSRIVVPKELRNTGVGSDVMNQIVNYADATGNKVALTPSTDFGASSVLRLKDFYKKFGFVENKGKAKDFSTRETMYREPKK